jgi:hypothetical protein
VSAVLSLLVLALAAPAQPPRVRVSCSYSGSSAGELARKPESWNVRGAIDVEVGSGPDGTTFLVTKRRWWSGRNVEGAGAAEKSILLIGGASVDASGQKVTVSLVDDPQALAGTGGYGTRETRQEMARSFVWSAALLYRLANDTRVKESPKAVPVGRGAKTEVTFRRRRTRCVRDAGECLMAEIDGVSTSHPQLAGTRSEELLLARNGRPVRFTARTTSPAGVQRDLLTCTIDPIGGHAP